MPNRKHPVHFPVTDSGNKSIIIFLTLCTKNRKCILNNNEIHESLLRCWNKGNHWRVGRYMIMPDHIHLFCSPHTIPPEPLKTWIRYWKREFSKTIPNRSKIPFWQTDFWDRQLRSGDSYSEKWDYVKNNPVRAGLVDKSDEWAHQGEIHSLMWHDWGIFISHKIMVAEDSNPPFVQVIMEGECPHEPLHPD